MVKQKVILEQAAQIVDFSQQKTVKKRAKTPIFEQKTAILCLKTTKKGVRIVICVILDQIYIAVCKTENLL